MERRDPRLAAWLIAERRGIEQAMTARLGDRAPAAGAPEAEALRRFRSFAASALQRGETHAPALDGVRAAEARMAPVLAAWTDAAATMAGARGDDVRRALEPLSARFRAALRQTAPSRRKSGAPRTGRRAVVAAIDRVADGFLAVDVDTRRVVDANPAAGALLGIPRDALLHREAAGLLPESARDDWWTELDAVAEGGDARRFRSALRDAQGRELPVEASITRHTSKGAVLALLLLRPLDV